MCCLKIKINKESLTNVEYEKNNIIIDFFETGLYFVHTYLEGCELGHTHIISRIGSFSKTRKTMR